MKQAIQLSDHFGYRKLLFFTLPSVGMMIFTSIYGVVDGFFVSNFAGKTPFAAVNLMMPFLMILSSVGFMFGAGGSAIVAKTLGEGEKEKANRHFSLLVYLCFAAGVILAALGFWFLRPVAVGLGAQGELLEHCLTYSHWLLAALPFTVLQYFFQAFFITAEKPKLGFICTLISGGANIVLDGVLVPLLPQEYKLAGAAVATVVSQILGGGLPLLYFLRKNTSLLRLTTAAFEGRVLLKACTNGSSEFVSNVSMSLAGVLYNVQLIRYAGENGIAAYGTMMYVSMIFCGAFIGYSIGTAPVISYHYGAQNQSELRCLLRKSLVIIGVLSVSMLGAAELLAEPLARLFVGYDRELMALTLSGFRIFSLSFLFMGFAIFASGFFTALNDGLTSAVISFLRTVVFQILAVILLPLAFGIEGVWLSVGFTEIAAVLLSVAFLMAKQKKYQY